MKIEKISTLTLDDEQLKSIEVILGLKFPKEYREFLKNNNGGKPTPSIFDFDDGTEQLSSASVRSFLTLDNGNKFYNLLKYIEIYRGRIPNGYLPVACDSFGNLILVMCEGTKFGSVYFWDHEKESEKEGGAVSFVADSFKYFLDILHE